MHLAAHGKNAGLAFNRLVDLTECYEMPGAGDRRRRGGLGEERPVPLDRGA